MYKSSDVTTAPAPWRSASLYKAILLTMLLGLWSLAAPQQSAALQQQQKKASQKAKPTYSCPMDPEVKSTKRGKCPKCGMALRLAPIETSPTSSANPDASGRADQATAESALPSGTEDSSQPAVTKMHIPDIEVLDQDGNNVHFYSDLVKDKTVAINFIFTTCTTICPPLAATFARVQKEMGEQVGRDVHFISISVDPATDTPERLKAWGAKFKAGAGWTFVTGDKQGIDKLLSALGAAVARRADHSPTVIIGNAVTGEWTRTYGLAKPSQLVALILKVKDGAPAESMTKETHQP